MLHILKIQLRSLWMKQHMTHKGRRHKRNRHHAVPSAGLSATPRQKRSCSTPSLPNSTVQQHWDSPHSAQGLLCLLQSPKSHIKKNNSPLLVYNHGSIKSTGERSRKPSGRPSRLQFKMRKLIFLFLLHGFQILQ